MSSVLALTLHFLEVVLKSYVVSTSFKPPLNNVEHGLTPMNVPEQDVKMLSIFSVYNVEQ